MKIVQDAEIALLKQELINAKSKLLQFEADNKDLVRKNSIMSETIKIYEKEQSTTQRQTEQNGASSSHLRPSAPSPTCCALPTLSYSGPSSETLDRIINYLLDTVQCPRKQDSNTKIRSKPVSDNLQGSVPPSSTKPLHPTSATASCAAPPGLSHCGPLTCSGSTSSNCPSQTSKGVDCSSREVSEIVTLNENMMSPQSLDLSETTIDEFMETNTSNSSKDKDLNFTVQTNQ